MKCTLCKKEIKNYNPEFNLLMIDESVSAEICADCINKFVKWQQKLFAQLFPTTAMKKRFGQS